MNDLFLLLFLVSFVCLIIGIIKPTIFSKFIKENLTRKKVATIFGLSTIGFFILFGMSVDSSEITPNTPSINDTTDTTKTLQEDSNENIEDNTTTQSEIEKVKTENAPVAEDFNTETAPEATQEPTPTPETSQAEPENEKKTENVSAEYKSALNKATLYASTMNMSKQGVYDQLVSEYGEKFSASAAQYGIDNVKANWNANALAKAKTYQDTMDMSPSSIYDQLVSSFGEKFTKSEANYAIEHLND